MSDVSDENSTAWISSLHNWSERKAKTAKLQMALVVFIVLISLPSLLGIITNAINIRVFLKMRLRDSVTISFFSLSCSDLMVSFTTCMWPIAQVLLLVDANHNIDLPIDAISLMLLIGYISEYFRLVSQLCTCFLAVLRSMCVLFPFRFKFWFTAKMSARVNVILAVFSLSHLIIFTQMTLRPARNQYNSTQLVIFYKDSFPVVNKVMFVLTGTMLTIACMVVASISVVMMIYSLKGRLNALGMTQTPIASKPDMKIPRDVLHSDSLSSLKLEEDDLFSPAANGAQPNSIVTPGTVTEHSSTQSGETRPAQRSHAEILLKRSESRVITQVTLVATIFVVSSLPTLLSVVVNFSEEDVGDRVVWSALDVFVIHVRHVCIAISASINIFVYLKYNRKYKDAYTQLCC